MLQLQSTDERELGGKPTLYRTYRDPQQGTEVTTYKIYTDKAGHSWWAFENLYELPIVRMMSAQRVMDLYGHGLSLQDVKQLTAQMKAILKSDDPERYEKAFAKTLEIENLSESMADPVKQMMGLVTVYVLLDDEHPDSWRTQEINTKMTMMSLDITLQSFFLRWLTGSMQHSGRVSDLISRIASSQAGDRGSMREL